MDRCHRIGQQKPVLVLRLATAHSVEGKMLRRWVYAWRLLGCGLGWPLSGRAAPVRACLAAAQLRFGLAIVGACCAGEEPKGAAAVRMGADGKAEVTDRAWQAWQATHPRTHPAAASRRFAPNPAQPAISLQRQREADA